MVKPYRHAMFTEHVVAELEQRLSRGVVKPGERLPNERQLAADLGVNILAVRKGLHILKAMGVVESRSGAGTYVTNSPPTLELEALTLLAPLQTFSQKESLVARRLLEVSLAGLAAKNASEDDVAAIAEEVTEMYASLEDPVEYLRHDIRFHHALGVAAKNPVLATLTDMVAAVLYDVRRKTVAHVPDLRQSVEMHRRIYTAVRYGNAEAARVAMSEHLMSAEHDISKQDPTFCQTN
jgi:GntR family transcriptional repressor for pyruvate dehydrogenase complex